MAHHEPEMSKELRQLFNEKMQTDLKLIEQQLRQQSIVHTSASLGATGQFPEGKLTENDEGEIQFALAVYKGKVVINFGTPVASIGMLPEQAKVLARALMARAKEAIKDRK